MKNLLSIFAISIILSTTLVAQKNTIVTIDGRPISKEEFEIIYNKNNTNLNDDNEIKSPQDYMKMFIDFKLKVIEAENRGLDTTQSFINELAGYRDELAKIYLTDVSITDSMVKVAYYRSVNLVKVSHILLRLDKNASPEDALKAYNKSIEIRNKYLNKEKTFGELAREYSEDPNSEKDSGSLPYFSAFRMITPFEDAAFSTKVGDVTMPVRTQFGYHLINVEDLKPSLGEIKVAHIMKKFNNINEVAIEEENANKAFMDSVYTLLQNGADFGKLAGELSDDNMSAKNGGEMQFISQEFGVTEFTNAAFSLKNDGDYSKPVRTEYGWHIIKRLENKPVQNFEEMEPELTIKVKEDPLRSEYSKLRFINARKKEYGFIKYDQNIEKFHTILTSLESDTIISLPDNCKQLSLFKFAGIEKTANDYYQFLIAQPRYRDFILISIFSEKLDDYIEDFVTSYENSRLEDKYPEFKYLVNEYHDGILLFSIMESEVWNKAIEDSVGLQNYYNQNNGKYLLGEHFDGLLIKCVDEKSKKLINELIDRGDTDAENLMRIANISENGNFILKGRWEKGANRQIDYLVWKAEKPSDLDENLLFVSGSVKESGVKTFEEARGLYISDYQNEIEKQWMQSLHTKYSVVVNEKLLKKIKSIKKKK